MQQLLARKAKSWYVNIYENQKRTELISSKIWVSLQIPSFWCPTTLIDIDGSEKTWPLPTAKYETNFINSYGLRYEAEEVRQCILNGKKASELVSHEESLRIARIQDEIRKQVGVHFDEDD